MDEQASRLGSQWPRETRRPRHVYFSVQVPNAAANDISSSGDLDKTLKRFPLELHPTSVERSMRHILRECGIDISDDSKASDESVPHKAPSTSDPQSRPNDYSNQRSDGMDFGGDFSSTSREAFASRRRKRVIVNFLDFLRFMTEPRTREKQQQRSLAWRSIESVKGSLLREFGLSNITTSCGWASVHLNAALMSLLKTMRMIGATTTTHGSRRSDLFRDVTIDVSADASEIDAFNEYTIVLNVSDVPVQWVAVLENVDERMASYVHAARESLRRLEHDAMKTLDGRFRIKRGRSCSAIAFRGFLQELAASAWIARDICQSRHRILAVTHDQCDTCSGGRGDAMRDFAGRTGASAELSRCL
ncbi:hypothetical protein PINS_up006199 [Pythium insidiosum]|nr:hypothetical protein PINS_up006199 [Pythium insidiosum]